jgi:2-methylcitrate dehydratase PrpD
MDGVAELRALAAYVAAPTQDVLAGPDTALWASARLLDSLGNISHGSAAPVSAAVRTAVDPADGKGIAAWPGLDAVYRPDDAGLLLGVYAFSENYCDTGLGSVAHLGSIVIPALLIAAQERVVAGRDALAAIAVGYNVMEYLGATVNGGRPRMASQLKGFRPTASAGPVAAVAVLARLAGLPPEECRQALALACSQGGGLRRSPIAPTAAIRIQSGEAVRRAVQTLRLSRAGIAAHPDMLRAPGGFFAAYGDGELGQVPVPRTGADGFLATASMKLDCTPHTLVTMLDAVRRLAAGPAEAAAIEVWVPAQHHTISGEAKPPPRTFPEGASHAPFCLALAATQHTYLYPAVVRQGLRDPRVLALAERVSVRVDDRLTAVFDRDPSSWPARVRIQWHNGATSELELLRPETADWSARDALDAAAAKVAAILGGQAGADAGLAAGLAARYAAAASWPDLWAGLVADPLTKARPGPVIRHG